MSRDKNTRCWLATGRSALYYYWPRTSKTSEFAVELGCCKPLRDKVLNIMLRGKVKLSAAFLARLISCVYQVSFCWCFFCSCNSCCKGDIPSDGDAAKSDPQMDCNPKPNTVINYFEISQGHINKEQMNNSTWLRSACIHIGGTESTLITTTLTTPQLNHE